MRLGYFLAAFFGDTLFRLSARHRNIVGNNIQRILVVEPDNRRLRWTVRNVFKNMIKNYFDLTRLSQLRAEDLEESVTIEGWHHLTDAVTNARGTIIATAHLGNFEFAAKVLAMRGIRMTILVEPFNSTPFLRNIAKLRQRNGCEILPVSTGAMKESMRILRRGGTLTIACDRDIQGNGLKVKFFGEETSLPLGAIILALRTGAAIIPLFNVRKSNNRFAIYIEPPLRMVDTGNRRQSTKANLERLAAVMETYIRRYPEQWVVLEPIWRKEMAGHHSTPQND
jgi:KDO2-lipid IV(A) lauroyltransferase